MGWFAMEIVLVVLIAVFGLGLAIAGKLLSDEKATTLKLRQDLTQQSTQKNLLQERGSATKKEQDEKIAALSEEVTRLTAELSARKNAVQELSADIERLNNELAERPRNTRKIYRVITFGVKGTGKTSLTLKWANPLTNLGKFPGTQIERYERTVSNQRTGETSTEHVFEIRDWGGERLDRAQAEAIKDDINGLLIVVDLAAPPPEHGDSTMAFSQERVNEQLYEFQAPALRYLISDPIIDKCQCIALFINKADVLSGTPSEVEQQARAHYKPLIDNLSNFKAKVKLDVFVGSAQYGHNTHHLFSYFVRHILPKNAYDQQLLRQLDTTQSIVAPERAQKTS